MKHLKPADVIDAAEGSPSRAARQHLEECEQCRTQVASAAVMLADLRADETPQPSPLFWEHFSGSVRARVAAASTRPAAAFGWQRRWIWAPAGALVAVVAIAAGLSITLSHNSQKSTSAPASELPGATDTLAAAPADDADWEIVTESAEGFEWEDTGTAEFVVRPGAAERAAMQLSDDQRQELARLIREEIGSL